MMGTLSLFEPVLHARDFVFRVTPIVDYRLRKICAQPYPGHPKGCPKFNQGHLTCPPDAPLFWRFFDEQAPVYAIVNEFDIKSHMARMAASNPGWSEAQQRCCLYWQPKARKQLQEKIAIAQSEEYFSGLTVTTCPEGMGVNVTETLRQVGIELEWPPVNVARQVALMGTLRQECQCRFSDSWRCAKDQNLFSLACPCKCHKQ